MGGVGAACRGGDRLIERQVQGQGSEGKEGEEQEEVTGGGEGKRRGLGEGTGLVQNSKRIQHHHVTEMGGVTPPNPPLFSLLNPITYCATDHYHSTTSSTTATRRATDPDISLISRFHFMPLPCSMGGGSPPTPHFFAVTN